MDIYADNQNIIPEGILELTFYMEEVLPVKIGEEGMELNHYLQQLNVDK